MKLTNLLQGNRLAKMLALITAVHWDRINKAHCNYYELNCPETPPKEAFTNSPQQF